MTAWLKLLGRYRLGLYGVYLTLKTDNETISIHLGPDWYIEKQDVKIESGDKIEVKGSNTTFDHNSHF